MVTAVRFSNGQEAFPLTTAAQNIHVFLRKSLLHKKHFFEWLKTANFSTACGTVTLKSPPSQAFAVSDVHQRLRKHLSRCTLDCGFKTSKSPALRGFVGGAAGACDCGPLSCTKIERPSPFENSSCKVRFFIQNRSRKYRQKVTVATLFQIVSHPAFQLPPQTAHVCFHSRKWVHTRLCSKNRTQRLTGRNRGVSDGGGITTLGPFRTFRKPCVAGAQNGKLCRFWVLVGCALEKRRKPAGQRCVHACRCSAGVAAPLGCAVFFGTQYNENFQMFQVLKNNVNVQLRTC